MLERTVELTLLGWVNKLGGVILYGLFYLFGLSVLLFFADQVHLLNEDTKMASVTWNWLEPWGPWVLNVFSKLIPLFKDMFTDLQQFFEKMAPAPAS